MKCFFKLLLSEKPFKLISKVIRDSSLKDFLIGSRIIVSEKEVYVLMKILLFEDSLKVICHGFSDLWRIRNDVWRIC